MKFTKYLILLALALLFISEATAQSTYKKFTDKQLRAVVPSQTRFVHSLAGNWDMTFDGGEWSTVSIPYSNPIDKTSLY